MPGRQTCTGASGQSAASAEWRTSAHSGSDGNCVETASWRKTTYCAQENCVEAAHGPGVVGVRDSKLAESPVLEFAAAAWREFTQRLK